MSTDRVAEYYLQGQRALDGESYQSAIDWFTRVIEVDPEHLKAYTCRARACEAEGQLRDALLDAREIVKLTPDSHKGYLIGGRLLRLAGKFGQAVRMLDQALVKAGRAESTRMVIEREIELAVDERAKAEACPISRLPAELFVHIISIANSSFAAALPGYHASASDSRARLNPIVAASRVCRHWNAALRDNPKLWGILSLDGQLAKRRTHAKVNWWVAKATATALPDQDDDDEQDDGGELAEGGDPTAARVPARRTRPGLGITSLVVTRAQHFGERGLQSLFDQLLALDAVPALRRVHISWMGPATGANADEERQIRTVFAFLARHAHTTLESITIHTPSHLRLLFSLPRFGAHFAKLESLELRSARSTVRADDIYLPPSFLPEYNGEDDWAPTAIKRLVLVGPMWRLEFRDRSIVSPVLAKEDVPALREIELGPTTPPMTWDLLSTANLRQVVLTDHYDQPAESDPKVAEALRCVEQLALVRSASLAKRILNLALAQHASFRQLTSLNLRSASLTTAQMALFSTANAPLLRELHLSSTAAVQPEHGQATLELPLCAAVKWLDVSGASWVNDSLPRLAASLPALERINLSGTEVTSRPLLEFVQATLERVEGNEKGLSRLLELDLTGCNKLETVAIKWIRKRTRPGVLKYTLVRGDEDQRLARHGGQW